MTTLLEPKRGLFSGVTAGGKVVFVTSVRGIRAVYMGPARNPGIACVMKDGVAYFATKT